MLKIKLNKQQCKSYKEALLLRNFNLGYIGIKILCDRKCSDENKKEYFTRILNGKTPLTAEELQRLEFFATCSIIDREEYRRLKIIEDYYEKGKQLFVDLEEFIECQNADNVNI